MFQSPFTSQQRRPPSASRTPFHSLLMLVASLVRAAGPKPGPQLQVPLSPEETLRRTRRKGSYHLIASRNKLPHPDDPEEEEDDMLFQFLTARSLSSETAPDREKVILQAKSDLLRDLASSSGDTLTSGFKRSLEQLVDLYDHRTFDARKVPPPSLSERNKPNADNVSPQLDGMWLTLSVPQFQDCLGFNKDRQLQYTLGRMSFDMFRPGQLICSIQGTFNPIHVMDRSSIQAIKHVPKSLRREVKACNSVIRSYDIVTAFTIEPKNEKFPPHTPNDMVDEPILGLMTTYGYVIPNPKMPNRLSVWFSGGSIEVNSDEERWRKAFDQSASPKPTLTKMSRIFGAKVQIGASPAEEMESDGKMSYELSRPLGGHDKCYIDILYLDETLRISRANTGAVYVCARVPYFPDE